MELSRKFKNNVLDVVNMTFIFLIFLLWFTSFVNSDDSNWKYGKIVPMFLFMWVGFYYTFTMFLDNGIALLKKFLKASYDIELLDKENK